MLALVKYAPGDGHVALRDVPEPVCQANQVKIEVAACGICGTDLHVYHDRFRNFPPVILGHEFSGTIVARGTDVPQSRLGQRVTVLGAMTVVCGKCRFCRQGEIMFCAQRRGMGHGVDGAFTKYVCARDEQLYELPDSLPTEQGALVEPLAAAVHAVCEMSQLRSGETVLVSGPGPIGLMCLKLLVAAGIKTLVAGTAADTARLELARKIGAARVIEVEAEDLLDVVRAETLDSGVDLALECSGAAVSVGNCLNALAPLGRLTQVGHFGREITIPYDLVAFRQIQITGSVGYTQDSWRRTLTILSEGRIDLADLITHRLPLQRWEEGFRVFEEGQALKVLLTHEE